LCLNKKTFDIPDLAPGRTRGQIEAEIANAFVQFYRVRLGRGPDRVRTVLFEDMVLVRQHGALTLAEQHLVRTPEGWDIVRRMRRQLVEAARTELEPLIGRLTGRRVVGVFSDTSRDGDALDVFTFAPPRAVV
jgi:uncharacterized protein YbcI